MRKQTKIAAVVSAAALLALGASITSFAAAKGTWMMVDGEWYCYDKNGEAYENKFCSSNGKEYYVGDDGQLVRSAWVDGDDGDKYFVNSSGAKITNDWRLTTPCDDDSADEEWYYFQSNGKMAANKKITYKGKTYYFDTDGKMLTGWVTTGEGTSAVNEANGYEKDHTFYCDETGARVEGAWVKDTKPGTSDDDADEDEHWYYLKKTTGKPATGKQANVNGQIYIFNDQAEMLYGWVAKIASGSNATWEQLNEEDNERAMNANDIEVYYCGDEDDGHAKKNKWAKTWLPEDKKEESDDMKWFWFDKNGKLYRTEATASNAIQYDFKDGVVTPKKNDDGTNKEFAVSKKKVNSKDYWFRKDGAMLSKFYMVDGKMYYFGGGDDGAMKTGSQAIKDDNGDTYKFYFGTKTGNKGQGITGNQGNKLYYYGMLIQADDYKYQLASIEDAAGKTHTFIINANGSIQHSKNTEYKEDGDWLIKTDKNCEFESAGDYKYAINEENLVHVSTTTSLPDVEVSNFVVLP